MSVSVSLSTDYIQLPIIPGEEIQSCCRWSKVANNLKNVCSLCLQTLSAYLGGAETALSKSIQTEEISRANALKGE